MASGTVEIYIACPSEAMFAFVSDLERAPEWVPDLIEVTKVSDGAIGVGTRYTEIVQIGSSQPDAGLIVTEFDPPRVFAHRGKGGPSEFTGRFVVEADGTGTRLTHEWSVTMSGLYKLLEYFSARWIRTNTEAGVECLREKLESA